MLVYGAMLVWWQIMKNKIIDFCLTLITTIIFPFWLLVMVNKVMKVKDLNFNGALEYILLQLHHEREALEKSIENEKK